MNTAKYALFAIVLLCAIPVVSETHSVPGGIRLLPGFVHRSHQGIDSRVGEIVGTSGLRILYDIGEMAGVYTNCKTCGWIDGELWRRKQQIDGHQVVIVYTKARRIIVSFPESKANFYATANSRSDITDVLLMVLTFHDSR